MIINNQDKLFIEEITQKLQFNSVVKICSNSFSFNAIYDLIEFLKDCKSVEILIQKDDFETKKSQFIKDVLENETNNKLQSYYRLKQVIEFIEEFVVLRQGITGGSSFMVIDDKAFQFAPNKFNEPTLGVIKDGKPYMIFEIDDSTKAIQQTFDSFWNSAIDCTEEVINMFKSANVLKYPELVYKYSISKIFEGKTTEDINEERLVKTGFKSSVVWNMLFNFQQDAVLGAIDKIENYNGCIIADSVGLGKTFEALAIIKYYELRNDRVLVLAPKKLRDNWVTYRLNDKRNILVQDRLNFDVLNHTDLSRDKGMSGDINLETVHWGNYDLIVIDESHNFRNNNPSKNTLSRYERLMRDVIKSGVRTKVLLLSATPVNTRLSDLKNQLAFVTETKDNALMKEGIASVDLTLRQAQAKFNAWMKQANPSRDDLIEKLDGDYFKLLDIFTISRSRKHIEKYYDVADIGKFPTRLKPISKYSDFDTENKDFSISHINDYLESLNLKFYSPMYFIFDHKREAYEEMYDTKTKTGAVFSQLDREESIITLMRVNLLKRLESSIYSFCLTVEKILNNIDFILEKIANKRAFLDDMDIREFDFDDDHLTDLFIGGKVKVLLQDMDLIKFNEFLQSDRAILVELLIKCKVVTVDRDQKLKDLKDLIVNKIENPINPGNKKIIVFSAFADTVKYLYDNCANEFEQKYNIKSALVSGSDKNKTNLKSCKTDLQNILINFSPISKTRESIFPDQKEEIDLLFCTDCISEGQNLQDCDYLVNYDIHWNPVRIIQRFGRIDRIGSINEKIQLVNFYPDIELDQYIDLVQRVKGRMQILDISASGDDNVIDDREGQTKELDYRKKQLEKMKDAVVDLEDLEGGISISDLTFNDFKVDAERVTDKEIKEYELYANGVFSLVENNLVGQPIGVLFCLKDMEAANFEEKLKANLLHPYSLVYVNLDGEIVVSMRMGKRALDLFKKLAVGKLVVKEDILKQFNIKTKAGKHMNQYADLLQLVHSHLSGEEKTLELNSIFNPNGSMIGKINKKSSYEVVSYLIVS